VSDNLPEQMHAPRSTALGAPAQAGNYDLDGQDIRLPRLKVGQSMTPAVKQKNAREGDIFVVRNQDDQEPVIIQDNSELPVSDLSDPVVFYVHSVRRGVNFKDPGNPAAKFNDLVLGPWGVSVLEFIQANPQIDPSGVYRKYDYVVTLPGYSALPVAFVMASSWGGSAASDLNTAIQLQRAAKVDIPTLPFRLQVKQATKGDNTYYKAFVGLAKVPAKDKAAHQELVQQHAILLPNAVIEDDEGGVAEPTAKPEDQPSLA
jgi:hypothetical protein